jgi:spore coat protein H
MAWEAILILMIGWPGGLSLGGDEAKAPEAGADGKSGSREDDFFGLTAVHDLHLEFSAEEWRAMEPARPSGFPGFFGPPGKAAEKERDGDPAGWDPAGGDPAGKKGKEGRDTHRSVFGMEFPWVRCSLTVDGSRYEDVGLRYKGNGSYLPSMGRLKRNLKVQLDRNRKDGRHRGIDTLNLNAGSMDPSKAREVLSYALFRAAGVPAPRTAFARVTITVPGKYDREYVGLYTVVEQVNRRFIRRRFQDDGGLLMKPEGFGTFEYLGEDWGAYDRYGPQRKAAPGESRRTIEFAHLMSEAGDERFRAEIASYLDLERFIRFVAVNALLANLDSIFAMAHNFYMYLDPETRKLVFIPWDLDLSFAAWPPGGSADLQMDLSIAHPHIGPNRLIDRLMALPDVKERYRKTLEELVAGCFARERLLSVIESVEKATREPIAKEEATAKARDEAGGSFGFLPPGMEWGAPDLRTFVEKRLASVEKQLSGKSEGYVPKGGFPGGPGGPGGFRAPGDVFARAFLGRADSDGDRLLTADEMVAAAEKLFAEIDGRKVGKLDADGLEAAMDRVSPPPRMGPGGPAGGPGEGPGPGGKADRGGRRANFVVEPLLSALDSDGDGGVSKDELTAGTRRFFRDADANGDGKLDEKSIAARIGRIFPAFPMPFGPPGGPPGSGPPAPGASGRKEAR